jgi:hypothetical protein
VLLQLLAFVMSCERLYSVLTNVQWGWVQGEWGTAPAAWLQLLASCTLRLLCELWPLIKCAMHMH